MPTVWLGLIIRFVLQMSVSANLRAARDGFPWGLLIAVLCVLPACNRRPPPAAPAEQIIRQDPIKGDRPAKLSVPGPAATFSKSADFQLLEKLHHAAQEMALDGFQFDKNALGWPHDAKVKSSAEFVALLVRNNYLTAGDAAAAGRCLVSNLSDSDPGETAFVRSSPGSFPTVIVRKDGKMQRFTSAAAADAFAPPPPREPSWLP